MPGSMMQDAAPCAVAGRLDEANYLSKDYFDAHLTEEGWRQAHALRAHIRSLPEPLGVDAVIVSPLTRALETAVGVFGGVEWRPSAGGTPLMTRLESEPVRRASLLPPLPAPAA
jgi:hypothetical protein